MHKPALLWKVLRANISVSQILGYALALLAGVSIVMIAAALYADGIGLVSGSDGESLLSDGVRVLSKETVRNPFALFSNNGFSAQDIENLKSQPWVRKVAPFTTSDFDASISADFGGAHFSTALFFESVPDNFYDSLPADWGFDPSDPSVTIILPSDYLALYNFGFAPARGLPRLSEQLICRLPFRVVISGSNGKTSVIPARIVGFSNRINTIAVPLDFLQWANEQFGAKNGLTDTNRLIVSIKGISEDEASKYFKQHKINTSGGSESEARLTVLLRRFVGIVAAVGAVLCLLSLFIMTLSLRLLVSKNKEVIQNLLLLGYSANSVASCYRRLIVLTNCVVLFLASVILTAAKSSWSGLVASMGGSPAPLGPSIVLGAVLVIILTAVSCHSLNKMIHRCK